MRKLDSLPGYWQRNNFYPIIAGGSGEPEVEAEEPVDDPYEFLKELDEEDQERFQPVADKFNASLNRQLQEVKQEYKPYEDLGSPEELERAKQIYNMIDQNPKRVYEILSEEYGEQAGGESQGQGEQGEQPQQVNDPRLDKIDQLEQSVNQLNQTWQEREQQEQQQKEDQELEEYLNNLRTEMGDFEEDYVLTKMSNGMSGEDAVKAYKDLIQQNVNEQNSAGGDQPPVLNGGGATGQQAEDVKNLGNNDVKSMVADLLKQSSQV